MEYGEPDTAVLEKAGKKDSYWRESLGYLLHTSEGPPISSRNTLDRAVSFRDQHKMSDAHKTQNVCIY